MRRWHPAAIGTAAAVVALTAAIGTAFAVGAFSGDASQPKPEVSLHFSAKDDQSKVDNLIGGDVTGKPAPSAKFALLAGGSATFADHRGTPMVVNFFATWCVPCVKEMHTIEAVHQELGSRVAFIGIDLRDSVSGTQELVAKTKVTYEIGRDPSGALFEAFNGVNMPSTFLIARDGTVVASHSGALTASALRDLIASKLP
ncbi:MAG: hypothetical protein QOI47_210 [Actinomycetota bacterium]|nr:hypothetical protein [Actinomycetota bacterium]